MTKLFVDCQYGIAGDMFLAALIDLGADVDYICTHLEALPISHFSLGVETKVDQGIAAKHLVLSFGETQHEIGHQSYGSEQAHSHSHIHDNEHSHDYSHHPLHDHDAHHHHHDAGHILAMIEDSCLPERVKERSLALFREIARAEAKIHGQAIETVQFHEVGAMDSIIDIIGVALALENLGVDDLVFSSVATGYGKVHMAHGLYPIPAPATAEILVGVPLNDFACQGELTTPTGAAFAKVLANSYAESPSAVIEKIGYGAGTKAFDHPNILRVMQVKKKK